MALRKVTGKEFRHEIAHTHAHMHVRMHTHTHMHTCTYACTHTHAGRQTQVCKYTYTHTKREFTTQIHTMSTHTHTGMDAPPHTSLPHYAARPSRCWPAGRGRRRPGQRGPRAPPAPPPLADCAAGTTCWPATSHLIQSYPQHSHTHSTGHCHTHSTVTPTAQDTVTPTAQSHP